MLQVRRLVDQDRSLSEADCIDFFFEVITDLYVCLVDPGPVTRIRIGVCPWLIVLILEFCGSGKSGRDFV